VEDALDYMAQLLYKALYPLEDLEAQYLYLVEYLRKHSMAWEWLDAECPLHRMAQCTAPDFRIR
jgi:hypothetical protein